MAWTQEKINEVYLLVQKTAQTDEEFRTELLEDPTKAITKLTGEEIPEEFKIKVIENDPAYTATFVLPPLAAEELDDEDLEDVAGGLCGLDGICGAKASACLGQNK